MSRPPATPNPAGPDPTAVPSSTSPVDSGKGPLVGHRSFTIIVAAIAVGILAYPAGGWFAAIAGAVMIAGALHVLLGS